MMIDTFHIFKTYEIKLFMQAFNFLVRYMKVESLESLRKKGQSSKKL